jgi:cobaltochelatase CobS
MSTSSPKVEDLVKDAIKEALEKRKLTSSASVVDEAVAEIKKTMPPAPAAPTITLKTGQKLFSDVIGKAIPATDDFAVSCFFDYPWDERIAFLVPEIDLSYEIDEYLARTVLSAWEMGDKTLMYGPSGAGKSSLIEQLCARTCRPFLRINCSGDMDSSMIFGQLTAKDGSTQWEDGSVTEAVKHGAVFAWDEWDVTPPEISMGLQWLLEENGKLFIKEKPGSIRDKQVIPHMHFRIVAIGNTQGQGDESGSHAGTNVQNTATVDRFGTAIYVDYLNAATEEKLLKDKWKLSGTQARRMVQLANLIRSGYKTGQLNLTMSPRTLFSMCKKLAFGNSLAHAYKASYLNKLNDTQRKVAVELFGKVYGSTETVGL